MSFLVSD